MEEKSIEQKGYVISDLHMFTQRSNADSIFKQVESRLMDADFLVFNGDTFDLKWSQKSMEDCVQWLDQKILLYSHCHFYFIIGNHDACPKLIHQLSLLGHPNFSIHETHLVLGTQLYLHGDLPLGGKNPFVRNYKNLKREPSSFMQGLYSLVLFLRLHRVLDILFSARYCTRKIWHSIEKYDPQLLKKIRNIYFGHTHVPFENHEYGGILFHNTGSSIQYSQYNLIQVEETR